MTFLQHVPWDSVVMVLIAVLVAVICRRPALRVIRSLAANVREINRKYATPEIQITRFVKICLLSLRIYLLAMVVLMVYGLVIAANGGANPTAANPESVSASQAAATQAKPPVEPSAAPATSGPRSQP